MDQEAPTTSLCPVINIVITNNGIIARDVLCQAATHPLSFSVVPGYLRLSSGIVSSEGEELIDFQGLHLSHRSPHATLQTTFRNFLHSKRWFLIGIGEEFDWIPK